MIEQFVIVSFAVYCLTSLLTEEIGPFMVFAKLRYLIGIRYFPPEGGEIYPKDIKDLERLLYQDPNWETDYRPYFKNQFALMIWCFKCTSVWVSLVAVLILLQPQDIVQLITLTLAVSGGARLIEALIDRG